VNDEHPIPPASTKHWTAYRKAGVVQAIRDGRLTTEQACRRFGLGADELVHWIALHNTHGVGSLRVCDTQTYRRAQ
jgi:hypothetical protein